jgi:hypothetical protein
MLLPLRRSLCIGGWLALAGLIACAPSSPVDPIRKAAILYTVHRNTTRDNLTYCVGFRDELPGVTPMDNYDHNIGPVRDPATTLIWALQNETFQRPPAFRSFSRCGGWAHFRDYGTLIVIEQVKLTDADHAEVHIALNWGFSQNAFLGYLRLEKGDRGWRVVHEFPVAIG